MKITSSYFRKVYSQFLREEISMSRMIELLNQRVESTGECKTCNKKLTYHDENFICQECINNHINKS